MEDITKRKLLRAACHSAALCSMTIVVVGVPIVILIVSNDPLVRDSAREAINYTISVILLTVAAVGLLVTIIGIPAGIMMLIGLAIGTIILPIWAIVSVVSEPDKRFRYPFTIRLLKSTDVTAA